VGRRLPRHRPKAVLAPADAEDVRLRAYSRPWIRVALAWLSEVAVSRCVPSTAGTMARVFARDAWALSDALRVQITDVGVCHLSALSELQVISMAHNDAVGDTGIIALVRGCRTLKSVNLK
jgi:hypothetical protein